MPYTYKGYTLPVHLDKQWHNIVDPFFRQLIDNDEQLTNAIQDIVFDSDSLYQIIDYKEIDDKIYTLRVYAERWFVSKTTSTDDTFSRYIARDTNNPQYTKDTAFAHVDQLIFDA